MTHLRELTDVVAALEKAWNCGDGVSFAAAFAEDADFVTIHGLHARGREAIAEGHNTIFRTVYAESTISYQLTQARFISDDIAVMHVAARLKIPRGPLAGVIQAVPSAVLKRNGGTWEIVAFHNTAVQSPAPSSVPSA